MLTAVTTAALDLIVAPTEAPAHSAATMAPATLIAVPTEDQDQTAAQMAAQALSVARMVQATPTVAIMEEAVS